MQCVDKTGTDVDILFRVMETDGSFKYFYMRLQNLSKKNVQKNYRYYIYKLYKKLTLLEVRGYTNYPTKLYTQKKNKLIYSLYKKYKFFNRIFHITCVQYVYAMN